MIDSNRIPPRYQELLTQLNSDNNELKVAIADPRNVSKLDLLHKLLKLNEQTIEITTLEFK